MFTKKFVFRMILTGVLIATVVSLIFVLGVNIGWAAVTLLTLGMIGTIIPIISSSIQFEIHF